jgi:hypothetical protein
MVANRHWLALLTCSKDRSLLSLLLMLAVVARRDLSSQSRVSKKLTLRTT